MHCKCRAKTELYAHEYCFRRNLGISFGDCWRLIIETQRTTRRDWPARRGKCKIPNVRYDHFTLLLNVRQKNGLPNCLLASQACSHHAPRLRLTLDNFNTCCHFDRIEHIFWVRVCLCISPHKPYTTERQCILYVDL